MFHVHLIMSITLVNINNCSPFFLLITLWLLKSISVSQFALMHYSIYSVITLKIPKISWSQGDHCKVTIRCALQYHAGSHKKLLLLIILITANSDILLFSYESFQLLYRRYEATGFMSESLNTASSKNKRCDWLYERVIGSFTQPIHFRNNLFRNETPLMCAA